MTGSSSSSSEDFEAQVPTFDDMIATLKQSIPDPNKPYPFIGTQEQVGLHLKMTQGKSALLRGLESLKREFTRLEKMNTEPKLPNFLNIKLKNFTKIDECKAGTTHLINALMAYENAIIEKQGDIADLKNHLNAEIGKFTKMYQTLPSHKEYRKLGLILAGVGVLVTAASALLFTFAGILSTTLVGISVGAPVGAFSTIGMVGGLMLTGEGVRMFSKSKRSTGLSALKFIQNDAAIQMNNLDELHISLSKSAPKPGSPN